MNEIALKTLLKQADFPQAGIEALSADYRILLSAEETATILEESLKNYRADCTVYLPKSADALMTLAERQGVHRYSAAMLFYLHHAPALRDYYLARYPEERACALFDGMMADLRAKLYECLAVFHLYGSFVSSWFSYFFSLRLFALGRLEFKLIDSAFDYQKGALSIKKGEKCIDVHIPSRGRLTEEILHDAYAQAAEFFAPMLTAPIAFQCESWLLFKEHEQMLSEDSGIRTFMRDYDYLGEAPDEGDLWRIFGDEDIAHPEMLSEDTSLRRAYKKHLMEHKPCAGGYGMFFAADRL